MAEPESQDSAYLRQTLLGALAELPASLPVQRVLTPAVQGIPSVLHERAIPGTQPVTAPATAPATVLASLYEHHPALPPPTPTAIPFFEYRPSQQRTASTSTGLHHNPPELEAWRLALFDLRTELRMSPEQHAAY